MSKGTKPRAIRVSDELWEATKEATAKRGETVSDVARAAFEQYISETPPES